MIARRLDFERRYLLGRVPWDTGITPPEVLAWLEGRPPGRALDLGCGTGTNALTLARGGWHVTAVDFSWLAVQAARRKAREAGLSIDIRQGDVARLEGLTGSYDFALDIGCFHSLGPSDRAAYSRRLPELLAPGAGFILYSFLFDPAGTRWPAQAEIHSAFADSFELVRVDLGLDSDQPSAYFTWKRKG